MVHLKPTGSSSLYVGSTKLTRQALEVLCSHSYHRRLVYSGHLTCFVFVKMGFKLGLEPDTLTDVFHYIP
jgi:hypothetical protein